MNSYHDATHLPAPARRKAEGQARSLESQILAYYKECYKNNHGAEAKARRSPSEVFRYFREKHLITSVRRAITNLAGEKKKDGVVVRPARLRKVKNARRTGLYGAPEGYWIYKPKPVQGVQQKLF